MLIAPRFHHIDEVNEEALAFALAAHPYQRLTSYASMTIAGFRQSIAEVVGHEIAAQIRFVVH